jgi:phosphatidate cytidylyltransferase
VSEARAQAPRSDLPIRFAAGVVMIAVAVAATALGGWWFRALAVVAAAIMLVEWADVHRVPRLWAWTGAALLAALLLAGTEYLYPAATEWELEVDAAAFEPNWIGFGAIALLGLLVGLLSRRFAMIGGTLYVGIPTFAMLGLNWVLETLVFWVFVVTWATDIMAYFAGRAIGGPKLAPRISPNKTLEGLLGGVVCGVIVGIVFALIAGATPAQLPAVAVVALLAVLFSVVGDLFESLLKRHVGVKDSGNLIPGHGGILDRVDGVLAALPVFALGKAVLGF